MGTKKKTNSAFFTHFSDHIFYTSDYYSIVVIENFAVAFVNFDLYFELTNEEEEILRSKISTSSWGGRRKSIKVFTEQGVYMLATVLKSDIATTTTIMIMRTFTKMREFALTYSDIIKRLSEIEKTIKIDQQQMNYNTERIDDAFALLTEILNDTKRTNKNLIGFRPKSEEV